MLTKILSRDTCARCKICCSFDSYDLWETPVVTDEIMERSLKINPNLQFSEASGARLFKMTPEPNEDLYYCPMLDHQKGCLLGEKKPFDCRIWPFRIMRFEGKRVIVLSPVCPSVYAEPFDRIKALADELAPTIFAEADKTPEMVKPYIVGYPILIVEDTKKYGK
ncbi:MAG: hypothetical protein LUI06_07785 [Ruminococcus sp.]|nr:hypothetical protein [Ruminococcus sp.]